MLESIYPKGLSLALSLTGYNALFLGLFVFLKRRDRPGFFYFLAGVVTAGWAIGWSFMTNNELSVSTAESWGRFAQGCLVLIPVTWLAFVLNFTQTQRRYRTDLIFCTLVSLVFLAALPGKWFIPGFQKMAEIDRYPVAGPAYSAFLAVFFTVYLYAFWRLARSAAKERSPEKRSENRLLFFGQLYGWGLLSLSFLPAYGIPFPQWNLILLPLWHLFLAYAMIRYHMLDLEEIAKVIQREKLAMLGTVAASINHEIRNPLYVMRGLIEVHQDKKQEKRFQSEAESVESAETTLSKLYEQALRALEIITRISMFVSHQTQRSEELTNLRLSDTLQNILPLIRREIVQDKIELEVNVGDGLPQIYANSRDVETVLFNLINNACQAMKTKGGRVWVLAARPFPNEITLTVQDNGPGIPKKALKKIFNPFYTTKKKGTGLGLYVTQRMVQRNRGKIFIKSKEGEGTTVYLHFPVAVHQREIKPQVKEETPPSVKPAAEEEKLKTPVQIAAPEESPEGSKKSTSLYGHALSKGE